MAAPDANEIQKLSEFRLMLRDVELSPDQNDVFLLRWIRARDGNLHQAENMLRQYFKWREEDDIDNILNWTAPKCFHNLCPYKFLGYDKENSPVMWIPFGSWNLRQIHSMGEKDNLIRHVDWMFISSLDYMKGKETSEEYPVTQFVYIVDMDALSVMTIASIGAVSMILQCVRRFEAYFPETMKACYFVNAGSVFPMLFALMRPLLTERTFSKMIIHGTDSTVWKPIFQKGIPDKVLPVKYGGSSRILDNP